MSNEKCFSKQGFIIGDPCYLLSDEVYDKVWGGEYGYSDGQIQVGDYSFLVHGTAHGDGVYDTSTGATCGVDSGTIAVVPLELVNQEYDDSSVCINWEDKPGDVELDYDNGTFIFTLNDEEFIEVYTEYDRYDDYDDDWPREDEEDYGEYNEEEEEDLD